jgi:RNA polymerase-binding protein DksA
MSNSPLTQEQLEYFKNRLLSDKKRLTEELEHLGNKDKTGKFAVDYDKIESGGSSDDDNASEISEMADLVAIEERLQKELSDVNKALKAMDDGTYGICKYTGKPIDIRRLEARPTSLTSVEAKKTLTQEL